MFRRTAVLCLRSACCVITQQNTTFLVVAHPGWGYDPQIRIWLRFLCNAPIPKFHHPMFTRSEVIVWIQTHPHKTAAAENIQCSSLRYDAE